jgi:hypothetical protein
MARKGYPPPPLRSRWCHHGYFATIGHFAPHHMARADQRGVMGWQTE